MDKIKQELKELEIQEKEFIKSKMNGNEFEYNFHKDGTCSIRTDIPKIVFDELNSIQNKIHYLKCLLKGCLTIGEMIEILSNEKNKEDIFSLNEYYAIKSKKYGYMELHINEVE